MVDERPHAGASGLVAFKISSIVTSEFGKYNIKTFSGPIVTTGTGALAESDLGTLSSSEDAYGWNLPEIAVASAKHLLKTGGVYFGRLSGTKDGKPVIEFSVLPVGETSSPTTLSGSGTTARSTTWSRATNGTPVVITRQRIALDGATQKVMSFTWDETYDACGLLISVGAETESDLDVGTNCT